ncbi:MAG: DUF4445 domain-containing protein [Bacteroidales bacterium]|nr:DUF4445 domain-containing protein [Bacteroidales bacterium]MBN2697789.1 DUF4445 domain-containing protein [Bacteroidales bacterium]
MVKVRIISWEKTAQTEVKTGTNLLDLIRSEQFDFYAPCGGAGTCGKCRVIIDGTGTVLACLYTIEKDITVHLPDKRAMEVLTTQYEYSVNLPFNPGKSASVASRPVGLAIDIGTTTIVYYLVDLITGIQLGVHSETNPQLGYGSDIISRINYCMTNRDGLTELRELTIRSINRHLTLFSRKFSLSTDCFTVIVFAGNNTMLHILAGVDPVPIALAPFKPGFTEYKKFRGPEMGVKMNPQGEVRLLPSVSAYVGADIVAGIASIGNDRMDKYLYVDIGTNGELAIVTGKKIWCCATAAGPAFEGSNISCGSGAFEGAISRFHSSGFSTIADAKPVSICGSGLFDIIAYLLDQGFLDENGALEKPFLVSPARNNAVDEDIVITPQDVREVQLAKGAIAAGISILLKRSGISVDRLDKLVIAGGFGNYLSIDSAFRLGMFPEELRGKTIQVGNAAGTGALLAVCSVKFMERINDVIEKAEYIELSYDEDFPMEFAMKMSFPRSAN